MTSTRLASRSLHGFDEGSGLADAHVVAEIGRRPGGDADGTVELVRE